MLMQEEADNLVVGVLQWLKRVCTSKLLVVPEGLQIGHGALASICDRRLARLGGRSHALAPLALDKRARLLGELVVQDALVAIVGASLEEGRRTRDIAASLHTALTRRHAHLVKDSAAIRLKIDGALSLSGDWWESCGPLKAVATRKELFSILV